MPTLSDRLRLKKHTTGDRFKILDYTDNWNLIDGAPGTFICTSGTRPVDWSALQTGRRILETDTGLEFRWNGSAWVQTWARGLVQRTERLTSISTTSFTYVPVVSTTSAAYVNRRHLVIVEAPRVYSTAGLTGMAIMREATILNEWLHQGSTGAAAANQARHLSFVTTDAPAAGSYVYSLQFRAEVGYTGTSYVEPNTNKPCAIMVVEI